MTPTQRKLARHALGLKDGQLQSFRNRYYAYESTPTGRSWLAMIKAGEATAEAVVTGRSLRLFQLTQHGALLALDPGETLDPEDFPT